MRYSTAGQRRAAMQVFRADEHKLNAQNKLLIGARGTGKSRRAERRPKFLPPRSVDEALETAHAGNSVPAVPT